MTIDDLALAFLFAAASFIGFVLGRHARRQMLPPPLTADPEPVEE